MFGKIFSFSLLLFCSTIIHAQQDTSSSRTYDETLSEFMSVSGADPSDDAMLNQLTSAMGKFGNPSNLDGDAYKNIFDKMMNRLKPVYKKLYTQSELEELISFYKTPLGQKHVENNKILAIEIMKISMENVREMMQSINGDNNPNKK